MTYEHLIAVIDAPDRDRKAVLAILMRHTNFGTWKFTVRPDPVVNMDVWCFVLHNEVNFASHEIVGIINDLVEYLQFEPWHIALNNVGEYPVYSNQIISNKEKHNND